MKLGAFVLKLKNNIMSIVALIALLTMGCNSSSSSFPAFSSQYEAATVADKDWEDESVEAIEALYSVSCGPTTEQPNDFLEDDNEAYACVVLVTDTEEKYTGTVGHLVAKLVSDETSEYASLVLASSSDNWHYYFQLAEGSYESVTSIVATAIIEGAHIVKTIEDPQSYDPESLN
jgi:hypothetical protein